MSVRDAESAALLGRIGVPAERIDVVPDPVMGLPLPAGSHEAARRITPAGQAAGALRAEEPPLIGVSLRRWRSDGADLARAAEALIALSKRMPVRLRFLPFHTPSDTEASELVMERLRGRLGSGSTAELAAPGDDPQQMLLEVSRCDALFGMRLHALIYAAGQMVPMLGLSYDPKIDQFLNRLGLKAIGTTDQLDAEVFAEAACSLLADQGRLASGAQGGNRPFKTTIAKTGATNRSFIASSYIEVISSCRNDYRLCRYTASRSLKRAWMRQSII